MGQRDNTQQIFSLVEECLEKGIPFVCYRLPKKQTIYLLIQYTTPIATSLSPQEWIEKTGFVFAPYQASKQTPIYFIEPDLKFSSSEAFRSPKLDFSNFYESSETSLTDSSNTKREQYLEEAKKLLENITGGRAKKVVLSRIVERDSFNRHHAPAIFKALEEAFPAGFVSLFHIPGKMTWCGATPEILFHEDKQSCKTVALAGTQKVDSQKSTPEWTSKEFEEQHLVEIYIEQTLQQFPLSFYKKGTRKTTYIGNLAHLATHFEFDLENPALHKSDLIKVLHPTPAVCGLPKEKGAQIIKELETHNREYYSGYLGPVNINQETKLFVNLRCMKLLKDKVWVFAGGGYTQDSVPQKEWEETCIKADSILSVITTNSKREALNPKEA